jgi:lambda family phage tail tape measure protein
MAADAAKLNKASEYARWWANSLDEAETSAKQLAASNQLLEASQEKLGRQMAINANVGQANSAALQQKQIADRKAQDDFIRGLEREVKMLNMSATEWKAYQAAQMGIGDRAAPLINQLNQSSKGMQTLGLNAKETAWAMRMVPAQMTDIVVSLQGGQAPLTVLLQQGGQLKDMFGGVGNAARAMGGYIMGLITPLTGAIVAASAIGYSFYSASREVDGLNKLLIQTGNTLGTTSEELASITQRVAAATGGTVTSATSVVSALAATGKVAAGSLETATTAIVRMSEVGLGSVEDLIEVFAEVGEKPSEAVAKLTGKYAGLTVEVYNQVRALEDQGQVLEANKIVVDAISESMDSMASRMGEQLGVLESGWNGLKRAIAGAWDTLKQTGRQGFEADIAQKILSGEITRSQAAVAGASLNTVFANESELRALVAVNSARAESAKRVAEAEAAGGRERTASISAAEAGSKRLAELEKARKKSLEEEVAIFKKQAEAGKLTNEQTARGIQLIKEQYAAKTTGRTGSTFDLRDNQLEFIQKQADAETKLNEKRQATIAILGQTTDALEKSFGRQNELFAQRNLSAGEKELADNLRAVKEEADKARKALADKFASMKEDTTVMAQYRTELEKVNELERDQTISVMDQAATKQLERGSWVTGAKAALTEYSDAANNVAENTKQAFSGAFKSMEDGLVQFAKTGKLEFRSFATSILDDMLRMTARKGMSSLLGAAASSGSFGWLGDIFGALAGARAAGGPIESGKSYLVGEEGPEIITAGASGFVTPNHALGGTTNNVSIVVNSDGSGRTETGENDAAQLGRRIDAAVRAVLMTEKRPGGMLA